jgi:hypothetical protein
MIKLSVEPLWYNRQLCEVTAIVKLEVDPKDPFKEKRPFLYLNGGKRLGVLECSSEETEGFEKRGVKALKSVLLRRVKDVNYGHRFIPYRDSSQLEEDALSRALGKILPDIPV